MAVEELTLWQFAQRICPQHAKLLAKMAKVPPAQWDVRTNGVVNYECTMAVLFASPAARGAFAVCRLAVNPRLLPTLRNWCQT